MYREKFDLTGKISLVTGGGRSIGLACAHALAESGSHVIIADLSEDIAEEGVAALAREGLKAEAVVMNVTDSARVTEIADSVVAHHGRIDVLVNNAGIARSDTAAEEVTDEHWRNVLDVNLNGVFWCCRAFGGHMLKAGGGAIVNVGSMSGFIVNKPQPQSYYNASKAAVHHLTRSLAAEWGERGVRVNAIAPTYIDTVLNSFATSDERLYPVWMEMTPMRRMGTCEEIGSIALFLASDASSLMTGSIVLADGGYTCW